MDYRPLGPPTAPVRTLLKRALAETKESPDASRGVGAVVYDRDYRLLASDHNRLPPGIRATDKRLGREPTGKYMWLIHAERAALATCFHAGTLHNAFGMVATMHPCENCAQAIIDFGLKQLITRNPGFNKTDERWRNSYLVAKEMLQESGVEVLTYPYNLDRNLRKRVQAPRLKSPAQETPQPAQASFLEENIIPLRRTNE